eukprot:CAMPEP_0179617066 /NCGR_PEP_ID=MMETSP0930-20121108/6961_1 /TAXON_ID=548131 ORGANISM="Ostreococcus mediterraneus, Strain clade-D-RCC1621" /NCGR_SAMPLE_ID=MMETSP0930 /ASSEMBLY_ACC=CAM_ASM_000580 /LENGTH=198 /DNA_ID=CAMNT_0021485947 /DNA_START=12 /DNA_END=606 /DNA_ORIENTATION=+
MAQNPSEQPGTSSKPFTSFGSSSKKSAKKEGFQQYAMGGQEGSPSKSSSSPKDKGKRKKRRREGAPSSSKGAKGEGNGRTTTAARGAEALECYPMIMKCACEQKHVQCFERAKGAANRCVFSKTDGVLGKIARDSWCLRVSRQSIAMHLSICTAISLVVTRSCTACGYTLSTGRNGTTGMNSTNTFQSFQDTKPSWRT